MSLIDSVSQRGLAQRMFVLLGQFLGSMCPKCPWLPRLPFQDASFSPSKDDATTGAQPCILVIFAWTPCFLSLSGSLHATSVSANQGAGSLG